MKEIFCSSLAGGFVPRHTMWKIPQTYTVYSAIHVPSTPQGIKSKIKLITTTYVTLCVATT